MHASGPIVLGSARRRQRVGNGRGPGDRRRAEARVAALLNAAVNVDHGRFDLRHCRWPRGHSTSWN